MQMSPNQAAKLLGLTGEQNPESIKKAYRKASHKYHPDRNPAGEEMMKQIGLAYEAMKDFEGVLKNTEEDYGDKYNDVIAALSAVDGIEGELCGTWIWVGGNTQPVKETLTAIGLQWARHKKMWSFRPADYKSRGRGNWSMDKIRETHGSQEVKLTRKSLAA